MISTAQGKNDNMVRTQVCRSLLPTLVLLALILGRCAS
jgi:hypothetical protein